MNVRPLALAIAASFACYATTLDVGFLSDDFGLLASVKDGVHALGWGYETGGFMRPLTLVTLALEHAIFGLDARGFHGMSILLHGIVGWLVGRLFIALAPSEDVKLDARWGLFATLLFVAHASHTEPVAWISCVGDLVATTLALAASVVALTPRSASARGVTVLGSGALLFLALLAKESPIAMPAVWCVIFGLRARVERRTTTRTERMTMVASFLASGVYLGLRRATLGVFVGGYGAATPFPSTPVALAKASWAFVVRGLLPAHSGALAHSGWRFVFLVFVFVPALVSAIRMARPSRVPSDRPRAAGSALPSLVAFALLCLPVLAIGVARYSTEGERLLYLPSAFLVVAFVHMARNALGPRGASVYVTTTLAFHGVALALVLPRWVEAGHATRAIVRALATTDARTTCVMNLPDSIGGAYVFRNGLEEALVSASGRIDPSSIRVAAFHDVAPHRRAYRIHASSSGIRLAIGAGERVRNAPVESCGIAHDGRSIDTRFARLPPEIRTVFAYAGGTPVRLARFEVPTRTVAE